MRRCICAFCGYVNFTTIDLNKYSPNRDALSHLTTWTLAVLVQQDTTYTPERRWSFAYGLVVCNTLCNTKAYTEKIRKIALTASDRRLATTCEYVRLSSVDATAKPGKHVPPLFKGKLSHWIVSHVRSL